MFKGFNIDINIIPIHIQENIFYTYIKYLKIKNKQILEKCHKLVSAFIGENVK